MILDIINNNNILLNKNYKYFKIDKPNNINIKNDDINYKKMLNEKENNEINLKKQMNNEANRFKQILKDKTEHFNRLLSNYEKNINDISKEKIEMYNKLNTIEKDFRDRI
jgi:hypothetical protein